VGAKVTRSRGPSRRPSWPRRPRIQSTPVSFLNSPAPGGVFGRDRRVKSVGQKRRRVDLRRRHCPSRAAPRRRSPREDAEHLGPSSLPREDRANPGIRRRTSPSAARQRGFSHAWSITPAAEVIRDRYLSARASGVFSFGRSARSTRATVPVHEGPKSTADFGSPLSMCLMPGMAVQRFLRPLTGRPAQASCGFKSLRRRPCLYGVGEHRHVARLADYAGGFWPCRALAGRVDATSA